MVLPPTMITVVPPATAIAIGPRFLLPFFACVGFAPPGDAELSPGIVQPAAPRLSLAISIATDSPSATLKRSSSFT